MLVKYVFNINVVIPEPVIILWVSFHEQNVIWKVTKQILCTIYFNALLKPDVLQLKVVKPSLESTQEMLRANSKGRVNHYVSF